MFFFHLPLQCKASTEETPRAIAGYGLAGTLQSVASTPRFQWFLDALSNLTRQKMNVM